MSYLPYELNHSEFVAPIGVAEIQSFAEDNFGGPLTENELHAVAIILAEADKSDLLGEAIRQIRPGLS